MATEITIFAKKKTTRDKSKTFFDYITTLNRKDGGKQTMRVRFREDSESGRPKPEKCPMNIVIEKGEANISRREYTREDTGEIGISYTLWIKEWTEGTPYIDTSLDEFENF